MAVTINGVMTYAGQVVSVTPTMFPVSSDHAWIDSGNRLVVELWDGTRGWTQVYHTDDRDISTTPDLSPEARAAYDFWKRVRDWVMAARSDYHKHFNREVVAGDTVEVFKGRKAPKGQYRVAFAGKNDFGKYYHLESGGIIRYVSSDNCRKVTKAWSARVPFTSDDTAHKLFTAASMVDNGYYTRTKMAQAYLVLADRLEELGHGQVAHSLRHLPEYTERQAYEWERERGAQEWINMGEEAPAVAK